MKLYSHPGTCSSSVYISLPNKIGENTLWHNDKHPSALTLPIHE